MTEQEKDALIRAAEAYAQWDGSCFWTRVDDCRGISCAGCFEERFLMDSGADEFIENFGRDRVITALNEPYIKTPKTCIHCLGMGFVIHRTDVPTRHTGYRDTQVLCLYCNGTGKEKGEANG